MGERGRKGAQEEGMGLTDRDRKKNQAKRDRRGEVSIENIKSTLHYFHNNV